MLQRATYQRTGWAAKRRAFSRDLELRRPACDKMTL